MQQQFTVLVTMPLLHLPLFVREQQHCWHSMQQQQQQQQQCQKLSAKQPFVAPCQAPGMCAQRVQFWSR